MSGYFAKMVDAVFNGRSAQGEKQPTVTFEKLLKRGTSVVELKDGTRYKVTVVKLTK